MKNPFHDLQIEAHDIWVAFSLLTRLPVPVDHARAGERGAAAAWAYPLVGLVLGAVAGMVAAVLLWLGLPTGMAAAAALAVLATTTGGMHEDGLSDFADGLGGHSVEQRLEIMKDSRIGAFGAIALILSLLARFSAIGEISGWGLVLGLAAIGGMSRAAMVLVMYLLPNARKGGLSASAGKPAQSTMVLALGIGLGGAVILTGWAGIIVFAIGFLAIIPVAWLANRTLGGQTGDVLGAAQQFAEIAALGALVALQ